MTAPKLQEIPKEWDTGYLRQVLDLWSVCPIKVADEEEDDRDQGDTGSLVRHCCTGDDLGGRRSMNQLIIWQRGEVTQAKTLMNHTLAHSPRLATPPWSGERPPSTFSNHLIGPHTAPVVTSPE